ncbi:MAG: hypothetical protein H7319_01255 [Spirosoma sp.]|nr:hypothetical protein [Spirosoma sp.]
MEQAKQYADKYQQADETGRAIIVKEYQLFLETLNPEERQAARAYMQARLRPQLSETMNTLDALSEQANQLLNRTLYA